VVASFFDLYLQSVTKVTVFRYDILHIASLQNESLKISSLSSLEFKRKSCIRSLIKENKGTIGGKRGGPVGIAEWIGIRPTAAYALQ
jgi:hypothetical protein